jgi:hypothetical protein
MTFYNEDETAEDRIVFSAKNKRRDPHREVELRVRERMSLDHTLGYTAAARAVFAADPALHRAYLDNAPPLFPTRQRQ